MPRSAQRASRRCSLRIESSTKPKVVIARREGNVTKAFAQRTERLNEQVALLADVIVSRAKKPKKKRGEGGAAELLDPREVLRDVGVDVRHGLHLGQRWCSGSI